MDRRSIVVGADGSDPGYTAVAWAAREAGYRRAPLRIVHVLEGRPVDRGDRDERSYIEAMWADSNSFITEATRRAHRIAPEVAVRSDTLLGRPVERLRELAREADLMVVGHRGRGGFAGLGLGSVGERVARRAPCPVAVVRGRITPDGPVVAGVDDSPAADAVLGTAFRAAADRAKGLVVVHAGAQRDRVEEQVAPWRPKYPRVAVRLDPSGGDPGPALAQLSTGARLVVVGSRGRDYPRSLLLGSTGLYLLHHAGCPVLITRPTEARDFGL
ncbi:universal stress protein [Actinoplanes sp. NPDC049596]|uniref:universal stress protein n=1 Tax=unclassified Actinoplanes TaxID=2626549 RepID=UPI003434A4FA